MLTELVDYKYYSKTYGGSSIPESSFKEKAIKASSEVNYWTSNRITNEILNNLIRNTTCEIADLLFEQDNLKKNVLSTDNDNKEVASESIGPHSISYVNKSNLRANQILSDDDLKKKIYNICYKNLVHTGLMYRGGIGDEKTSYDYNL